MFNVKRVILGSSFMRLDTEDGVAGCIHLQRTSAEINPEKSEQIVIQSELEARELIKLIEAGITFLNGRGEVYEK